MKILVIAIIAVLFSIALHIPKYIITTKIMVAYRLKHNKVNTIFIISCLNMLYYVTVIGLVAFLWFS